MWPCNFQSNLKWLILETNCQIKVARIMWNEIICVHSRSDVSIQKFTLNKLELGDDLKNLGSMLDYSIVDVNPLKETFVAKSNQKWSVAGFEINLERKTYKYFFNFFIPSFCIGTLSFVSWVITKYSFHLEFRYSLLYWNFTYTFRSATQFPMK